MKTQLLLLESEQKLSNIHYFTIIAYSIYTSSNTCILSQLRCALSRHAIWKSREVNDMSNNITRDVALCKILLNNIITAWSLHIT